MIKQVNLSTKVSVENLKNDLENANLKDFNQDIKRFNQWFKDKRTLIAKELGKDGYKEYTCYLYKAYLTCTDPKFLMKMEDEQQDWMLERKKPLYSYQDLMDQNAAVDKKWHYLQLVQKGLSHKLMWCAQNPCYSRTKFHKRREEKKKNQRAAGKIEASDDFKVALSAILTKDEYKAIESQFLN
eukprot:14107163-Ditylum_brightwellii.AAC.1